MKNLMKTKRTHSTENAPSRVDRRRAQRNYDTAVAVVTDYFSHTPAANILVLTLNYDKAHRPGITLDDIRRHRDEFLQNYAVISAMRGTRAYISKIEEGDVGGGLHIHLVILYSASCEDDVAVANSIGNYWIAVTGTKGNYQNSNERAQHYALFGPYGNVTGLLHRDDYEKMGGLTDYFREYVTKPDQRIHDESNAKSPAFTTSRIGKKPRTQIGDG